MKSEMAENAEKLEVGECKRTDDVKEQVTSSKVSTIANNDDNTSAEGSSSGENGMSPERKQLLEYGLDSKVASRLDEIYKTGKLCHSDLDDRALDALKEFPTEGALAVLSQFLESNLEHVSNKSAYLCGVMKTYRQKTRSGVQTSGVISPACAIVNGVKGPDESKIKEILDRTGYTLDVTTGQRKFGGPPPDWEGDPPASGCEVFCGKIPREIYESDLIPLFEKCGEIWDLRLMMDPMTGLNRGYAFVTFTDKEAAQEAVRQLNNYELGNGKRLGVTISFNNHRLFVGNIPKNKDKDELLEELYKHAPGLREVIIYSSPDDKKKNRGFCFLEYESHKAASLAKRRLETGRVKVWSCDIIVDWADPQEEPDAETMSQVKVLYVRNLTAAVTEDKLRETFEAHGKVERVKKIKDYAFVHFEDRLQAVAAMEAINHTELCGSELDISLAKPPSDKKKKEEMLRKREQRMMKAMSHNLALPPFPPFPSSYGPMGAAGIPGAGLYRGGPGGGRGGSVAGGSAIRGVVMPRGFDNGWQWGGNGWANESSWSTPVRGPVPMVPWMAAAETWGGQHPVARGPGSYAWPGMNGSVSGNIGVISGGGAGGPGHFTSNQRGGGRKGYSMR